jgi:hypothetical protein
VKKPFSKTCGRFLDFGVIIFPFFLFFATGPPFPVSAAFSGNFLDHVLDGEKVRQTLGSQLAGALSDVPTAILFSCLDSDRWDMGVGVPSALPAI